MNLPTAENVRRFTLKYIQVNDRRERADRIERMRKIIDYLYCRENSKIICAERLR